MNIVQIVTILTLTSFSEPNTLQNLVNGGVDSENIIVVFETEYVTDERENYVVCKNDSDCLDLYTPGLQDVDFSSNVVFDPICEIDDGSDVEEGFCSCGDNCYSTSRSFDDDTFYYCGPCGRIGSICNDTIKCEDPGICEGDYCLCPNGGTFYEAYYCYIPYYGYEVALQMAVTTCIIIALCLLIASIYNAIGMRRLRRLRGLREILRREEGVRESPPDDVPPKYDDVIGDLPTYQEALHLDQGTKTPKKEGIVNLAFEDDNGSENKQCQIIDEGENQATNHFQTCDSAENASIQESPPEYDLIFTIGNFCNDPELNRSQSCRKKTKIFRKREDNNLEDNNSELIKVMKELDTYQKYFESQKKRKRNIDEVHNKEFNMDAIESDPDFSKERRSEIEDKTPFERSEEIKEENLGDMDSGNNCLFIGRYNCNGDSDANTNTFSNKIKNQYDNDNQQSDIKLDQYQTTSHQPKNQYDIYNRQISDNDITNGNTSDEFNFSDRRNRDVSVRRKHKQPNETYIHHDFEISIVPTTPSSDASNLTTITDCASAPELRYSNVPNSTALTTELSDPYDYEEKKISSQLSLNSLKINPVSEKKGEFDLEARSFQELKPELKENNGSNVNIAVEREQSRQTKIITPTSESDQKGNNDYKNFAEEVNGKCFEMSLLSDKRKNEDGIILSSSENLEDLSDKAESSV